MQGKPLILHYSTVWTESTNQCYEWKIECYRKCEVFLLVYKILGSHVISLSVNCNLAPALWHI